MQQPYSRQGYELIWAQLYRKKRISEESGQKSQYYVYGKSPYAAWSNYFHEFKTDSVLNTKNRWKTQLWSSNNKAQAWDLCMECYALVALKDFCLEEDLTMLS